MATDNRNVVRDVTALANTWHLQAALANKPDLLRFVPVVGSRLGGNVDEMAARYDDGWGREERSRTSR